MLVTYLGFGEVLDNARSVGKRRGKEKPRWFSTPLSRELFCGRYVDSA